MEKEYIQATQPKFNMVHTSKNKKIGVRKLRQVEKNKRVQEKFLGYLLMLFFNL